MDNSIYLNNCCICLEECNEIIGCCNGFIHKKCLYNIFTYSKTLTIHCPLCRKNVYLTSSNQIIFDLNVINCGSFTTPGGASSFLNVYIDGNLIYANPGNPDNVRNRDDFVKKCSMIIFILLLIFIFIFISKNA